MLFVSTPSLFLYGILAVFYLASMTLFAASRLQGADRTAEITEVHTVVGQLPQYAAFTCEDNSQQHPEACDTCVNDCCYCRDLRYMAMLHDAPRCPLPDMEQGETARAFSRYSFSRPPPVID